MSTQNSGVTPDNNSSVSTPFIARKVELTDLNAGQTFNFIALRRLPNSAKDVVVHRTVLSMNLWTEFITNHITEDERRNIPKYKIETSVPSFLHRKWDHFILQCAQQYGARLLLSDLVMDRVWAWASGEERGSHKLRKLFAQMHRSARIGLRQAKGGITNRHRRFKARTVKELTLLRKVLRDDWRESKERLLHQIEAAIESVPALVGLRANKEQLLAVLQQNGLAFRFRGAAEKSKDDLTPTQLCIKLLAASENLSEEYTRQRLLMRASDCTG